MRSTSLALTSLLVPIVACSSQGEAPAATQVAPLIGGSNDAANLGANVVVALAAPTSLVPQCSGVLLTPTMVLTARTCLSAARAGKSPVVLVGHELDALRGFGTTGSPIIEGDRDVEEPATFDGRGELALIEVDPREPVLDDVYGSRQDFAPPSGEPDAQDDTAASYDNLAMAGWGASESTAACASPSARQTATFAALRLRSTWDPAVEQTSLWVRPSPDAQGELREGDLGGPLYAPKANGTRALVGIAVAAGEAAGSGVCPASASRCDEWIDVSAEPTRQWILDHVRRDPMRYDVTWRGRHPGPYVLADGTADWWRGEVDYVGPCVKFADDDCDHWYDQNFGGSPRDNCPGVANPDQAAMQGGRYGDACSEGGSQEYPPAVTSYLSGAYATLAYASRIEATAQYVAARAVAVTVTPEGARAARDLRARLDTARRVSDLARLALETARAGDASFFPELLPQAEAALVALEANLARARELVAGAVLAAGLPPSAVPPRSLAPTCSSAPPAGAEAPEARSRFVYPGMSASEVWWDDDSSPRFVADVTGDGRADIVGFGPAGIEVAAYDGARFLGQGIWTTDLAPATPGFESAETVPRAVGDVDGDGKADLVAFGPKGVLLASSTGTSFAPARLVLAAYGKDVPGVGAWPSATAAPRFLADMNGDGKQDIVGTSGGVVYVSLSTGTGFGAPLVWLSAALAGPDAARTNYDVPRGVADVNGDKRADLVLFAEDRILVALSTGTGLRAPTSWGTGMLTGPAWDASFSVRLLADVDGDKRADVVGLGEPGTFVALSSGSSFRSATQWSTGFGTGDVWEGPSNRPRRVGDLDGDGKADLVGFAGNGVYVSRARASAFGL